MKEREIIIKKLTKLTIIISSIIVFVVFFVFYAIDTIIGNNSGNALALPTPTTVFINGENESIDTYNINGFRYFKLNGLAYILSGTTKQFDIRRDNGNNAILLTSGNPYTKVDSEIASVVEEHEMATPSTPRIYLDDNEVQLVVHNIEDSIYVMLRDIAEVIDFYVNWDHDRIIIDTGKPFENSTIAFNAQSIKLGIYFDRDTQKNIWKSVGSYVVITSRYDYEQYMKNNIVSDSVFEMYTDDFFTNNYLVIISSGEGSGSNSNHIESLNVDGEIVIRGRFSWITLDMVQNILIVELNNTFLPAKFNVILTDSR